MKRSMQFVTLVLLAAGLAFLGTGCQSGGGHVHGASTSPDHPKADHPKGDHAKADHPKADHAEGDHPKADHPKADHPD